MDDKARVLKLLADSPQGAVGLSSRLGISRNTLFSLLISLEREGLIEWKGQEWAEKPSVQMPPRASTGDENKESKGTRET